MNLKATLRYTLGEDIANSLTHGLAAAAAIVGLVFLLIRTVPTGDVWRIISGGVYGGSLIFLFLMSTLYHAFPWPKVKHVFRLLDHSAIFLLIAGSYTPFLLVGTHSAYGWILFAVIWSLALGGILFEFFSSTKSNG